LALIVKVKPFCAADFVKGLVKIGVCFSDLADAVEEGSALKAKIALDGIILWCEELGLKDSVQAAHRVYEHAANGRLGKVRWWYPRLMNLIIGEASGKIHVGSYSKTRKVLDSAVQQLRFLAGEADKAMRETTFNSLLLLHQ